MPLVSTPLATNNPDLSAFWMNGGSVTRTSACGLDCSFSTRDTTSPEPASTRLTAMPVSLVNLSNWLLYHVASPSAALTVRVSPLDPDDPVPPQAAVMAVAIAKTTIAAARKNWCSFMIPSRGLSVLQYELGEVGDGPDDVGRSGVAELAVVVRAGECARGDGHTGTQSAFDVAGRVTKRCDVEHTVGLEPHERGEDQVGIRPAAHTVAGGEHKVGQRLPAERGQQLLLCGAAEPGGERHLDTVLAQAANRFSRACDRRGFAFVDELFVRALERGVGLLCELLTSEQRAEHADLGLTHGVEDVLPGALPFGAGLGHAHSGGGGLERVDDQTVVHDSGSGHVDNCKLNPLVLHRHSSALQTDHVGRLFSQRWSEGHAATTRTGDHPNAVIKRRSAHQLMRIDTLAVHAGPALPDRRKRTAEKLFDDVDEVGVRRLGHVERERLFVFVGVADRQPAVQSLHAQQLHPVLTGDRILGLVALQLMQRRPRVAGVVAEAVAVGDGGGQPFAQRFGLHHLQPHAAHWEVACELANEAAVSRAGAHKNQVAVVAMTAIVDDGLTVDRPCLGAG